jgi:hypothetical protein
MRWIAMALVAAALGCGGKSKTTSGGGGGEPATGDCEPGRCIGDIKTTVAARRPEARACYDDARQLGKVAGNVLVINFVIGPDGKVAEASQGMQDDQIEEPLVVECVIDVIKALEFRPSAAGKRTKAYHRFEFSGR